MARHLRRLAALSLAVGLATLLVAQTPTPDEPLVIPLRVHDVCRSMSRGALDSERLWQAERYWQAELVTHPCAAEDWLEAQIATANSLFAPGSFQFRSSEHRGLAPEHARIGTEGEMWELALQVQLQLAEQPTRPFGLDVFLVDEMFSSADAHGTVWAHFGNQPNLIVVAVSSTNRALLAHALGHYFGLQHSPQQGNPMFETPGEAAFDAAQLSHLRARWYSPPPGRFDDMRQVLPWRQ